MAQTPGGMSGWDFFDYLLKTASVVGHPGKALAQRAGLLRLTALTRGNTEAAARVDINKL